jgi:hypothetical protein
LFSCISDYTNRHGQGVRIIYNRIIMLTKRRILPAILLTLILSFSVSACGEAAGDTSAAPPPTETPLNEDAIVQEEPEEPGETEEEASEATKEPLPAVNPLTGLKVSDPQILKRKPVMVKVANYPQVGRPHAGLSFADIVFDYYIGYGQNRFLALFYGQDAIQIGPVRSGRRVDAELVTMYGGILGYGSADADTDAILNERLKKYAIAHYEAECPAFCGTDTHSVTGVFANSGAISTFVESKGWQNNRQDLPGMVFGGSIPSGTKYAEKVTVLFNYYNRGEWRYDVESSKYLRWIEHIEDENDEPMVFEMIPLVDRLTGEQLAFSNVIIIFAHHKELAPTAHEIEIWGNNKGKPAYLFRDGQVIEGTWRAKNDTDPMQFFNKDGSPMVLKAGNTWISIVGVNSTFQEVEPAQWECFFMLP